MTSLEKAIRIAVDSHAGQTDKAGNPYILHPLRCMMKMDDDASRIVAVLHDVLEDTDLTADMLAENGFSQDVIKAIECVTKQKGEDYDKFIDRISTNPLAAKVKLADIADNLNVSRLSNVTEKDRLRFNKYLRAIQKLSHVSSIE